MNLSDKPVTLLYQSYILHEQVRSSARRWFTLGWGPGWFFISTTSIQNVANNVAEERGRGSAGCRPPESEESLAASLQRRGSGGRDGLTPLITAHPPLSFSRRSGTTTFFQEGFIFLVVLLRRTDTHLQPPESDLRKILIYIPTLTSPEVSPALPLERLVVIIMHPDKCLPELMAEKNNLDPSFVHAVRLLADGKSGSIFNLICSEPCLLSPCNIYL